MKENFKETVSATLRSLRAEYKLKQKDVADRAGIDIMTLGRYENNTSSIQYDILEKIVSVYNMDLFIFF